MQITRMHVQEASIAKDTAGHQALLRLAELEPKLQEVAHSIASNLACQGALLAQDVADAQSNGKHLQVWT